MSATLLGGGAAGGVGSGRLLGCFVSEGPEGKEGSGVDGDGDGDGDPTAAAAAAPGGNGNVRGSAYLSIELSGCYLTEGSVGLLDAATPGGGAAVSDAWPFSSAPAAPVAVVLGNYSFGGAGGGESAVRVLTPGASVRVVKTSGLGACIQ